MSFDLGGYNALVNGYMAPLETPVLSAVLRLFLVLYGGLAAPSLPPAILKLFDNAAFRIAVMALIVWTANKDPATAILISVGFVVGFNTLQGKKVFEKFNM